MRIWTKAMWSEWHCCKSGDKPSQQPRRQRRGVLGFSGSPRVNSSQNVKRTCFLLCLLCLCSRDFQPARSTLPVFLADVPLLSPVEPSPTSSGETHKALPLQHCQHEFLEVESLVCKPISLTEMCVMQRRGSGFLHHSFIHSCSKCSLYPCHFPCTALSAGDVQKEEGIQGRKKSLSKDTVRNKVLPALMNFIIFLSLFLAQRLCVNQSSPEN